MAMTLKRFLYFSMSFSKVMSLALDATYSAEVVLQRRWTVTAAEEQEVGGLELNFLSMRIAIVEVATPASAAAFRRFWWWKVGGGSDGSLMN